MIKASRLIRLSIAALIFVAGCSSGDKSDSQSDKSKANDKSVGSEDEKIAYLLNDALVRLSYGDKSGLYEMEFEYFRDDKTFDEYLKLGQIMWASMDSLVSFEILSIEYIDDSAIVEGQYNYKGYSGEKTSSPEKLILYKSRGAWVKPTISVYYKQIDYEELIRQAEEAAREEG